MKLTNKSYCEIYEWYEDSGTAIHCEENICRIMLEALSEKEFASLDEAYEYVEENWAYPEDVSSIQSMIELK